MEKILVMVEKFKSFDGKIFDNEVECSVHEINKRIEKGEDVIVNELIDKNIITRFSCYADSCIDIVHGNHHNKIEYGFTIMNLINAHFIQGSIFDNKRITHIKYAKYGVIVYVHINKKDWITEIQRLGRWKNPKIIDLY